MLRTCTLTPRGKPVRPPRATREEVARFWAFECRPSGQNATALLDLGVLELYEGFDWQSLDYEDSEDDGSDQ